MPRTVDPFKFSLWLRHHFEHELVLDQTNCRRSYPQVYSSYPTLIRASASDPSYRNSYFLCYLSIKLFRCSIIRCLCILSSSGCVPMLTSAPLLTVRPFVELLSDSALHIQQLCEFFLRYIMPLVICILCIVNHALLSSLGYLLLELMV